MKPHLFLISCPLLIPGHRCFHTCLKDMVFDLLLFLHMLAWLTFCRILPLFTTVDRAPDPYYSVYSCPLSLAQFHCTWRMYHCLKLHYAFICSPGSERTSLPSLGCTIVLALSGGPQKYLLDKKQ